MISAVGPGGLASLAILPHAGGFQLITLPAVGTESLGNGQVAGLGVFDIVGISATDIVLLQVKTRDWPCGAEMEALRAFSAPPNARKILHRYRDRVALPDMREVP